MAQSKPYQDPQKLRELYHEEELTTREIADRLGCNNSTITRYLNKYDIQTRENWKAGVEAAKRANRVERVKLRQLPTGYMYWGSTEWTPDNEKRTSFIVYVHRLLAVAEYGFDAVADKDVHHKNGVKWDNRPDNIEVLDKAEHTRLGNEQRISDSALLSEIHRLADLVGGRPTTSDLREYGKYAHPTYLDRFGGWNEALSAAGVREEETSATAD